MSKPSELLKTAAAELQARDAKIAELTEKLATSESEKVKLAEAIQAKIDGQQKTAADLAAIAQSAAQVLLDRGLVKSAEDADRVAASVVADHAAALRAILKVASHVPGVQKVGTVVVSTDKKPETADEVWDRKISAHL